MSRVALLIFLLFSGLASYQQTGYLFIKKGGKKKRTYSEGDWIQFRLQNGTNIKGVITLLRNDTIFLNGNPVPRPEITTVILNERTKKPFPADKNTLLALTGGVALTTVGLSLNDQNKPEKALLIATVIGYGPLLVKHILGRFLYTLHRKKFRIRKQFRLQVLDFHIPHKKAF
jgi:hypothetical protein